jgi:hypothetical protein
MPRTCRCLPRLADSIAATNSIYKTYARRPRPGPSGPTRPEPLANGGCERTDRGEKSELTLKVQTLEVRRMTDRAKCLIFLGGATGLEPAASGVTGQEFSSKINDELTLFACNSGLQALQKCQPKTCPASPFGICILPRATRGAPQHVELKSTHRGHPIGPTIFAR